MENTMTNTESNESGENTMTRAIELENGILTQQRRQNDQVWRQSQVHLQVPQ